MDSELLGTTELEVALLEAVLLEVAGDFTVTGEGKEGGGGGGGEGGGEGGGGGGGGGDGGEDASTLTLTSTFEREGGGGFEAPSMLQSP